MALRKIKISIHNYSTGGYHFRDNYPDYEGIKKSLKKNLGYLTTNIDQ